jgi:hypothetical protein
MSSLKSLMASRRAQARIDAPFATYSLAGQLSCQLCGLKVKEALWVSHIVSKVRLSFPPALTETY